MKRGPGKEGQGGSTEERLGEWGGGCRTKYTMMWQGGYSTPPYLIGDVLDVSSEGEGEDLEAGLDAEYDGEADLGPVQRLWYIQCE